MKKTILTLVLATITCFTVNAQKNVQQLSKQEMIEKQTTEMSKELNLNATQQKQLKALNTQYADKLDMVMMRPMMKDAAQVNKQLQGSNIEKNKMRNNEPKMDKSHRENMKEMRANKKAYEKSLQTILTPEQYKQYQAKMSRPMRAESSIKKTMNK